MHAARRRAGLTQHEVARRMGTQRTSVSRAEAGRVRATIDFLERFARALGEPMSITFGAAPPTDEERKARSRVFYPRIFFRRYGIAPVELQWIGLYNDRPFDATHSYSWTIRHIATAGQSRMPWNERSPHDLRWPTALAAIWYDEIDWPVAMERIRDDEKVRKADIKARAKARKIIAARFMSAGPEE